MTPKTPLLETRALAIGYRRRGKRELRLGQGLDLRLQRGKLVGLLGPNGIGKSTLLRTLAHAQKPLAGQTIIAGRDIATFKPGELARQLSMVLTTPPPPTLMTGYGLVALGRQPHTDWLGRMTREDHDKVAAALRAVKGEELAEQPAAELSDGQRQKLLIARALAQESEIMLLDEPTAYLDLPRRIETMSLLKRLARSQQRAILVSTHDLDLALRSCDRLWLMSAAGIIAGAPEDLALDGSLSATFRAHGIHFDQQRGGFFLNPPGGPAVHVAGDGEETLWMRRAVSRAGFSLSERPGEIVVSRYKNGQKAIWKLRVNDKVTERQTIEAVLKDLERHLE